MSLEALSYANDNALESNPLFVGEDERLFLSFEEVEVGYRFFRWPQQGFWV